jgi:hypothetical protein
MNRQTIMTTSEIERILLQDPHIIRIEPGETWKRRTINAALFRNRQETVTDYISSLWDFLSRHYIIDEFTDHSKREWWRLVEAERLYAPEVKSYLARNAMRGSSWMIAYHCTDVINVRNYQGPHQEEFGTKMQELLSTYRSIPRIDTIPIAPVKELKKKVYAVLEFLADQSPYEPQKNG